MVLGKAGLARGSGRVALLDYGQSKQLPERERVAFASLLLAMAPGFRRADERAVADRLLELGLRFSKDEPLTLKKMAFAMFDTRCSYRRVSWWRWRVERRGEEGGRGDLRGGGSAERARERKASERAKIVFFFSSSSSHPFLFFSWGGKNIPKKTQSRPLRPRRAHQIRRHRDFPPGRVFRAPGDPGER